MQSGAQTRNMGYGVWSLESGVWGRRRHVVRRRAETSGDEDSEATRGDARRKNTKKRAETTS
jgi:hypothetical protein